MEYKAIERLIRNLKNQSVFQAGLIFNELILAGEPKTEDYAIRGFKEDPVNSDKIEKATIERIMDGIERGTEYKTKRLVRKFKSIETDFYALVMVDDPRPVLQSAWKHGGILALYLTMLALKARFKEAEKVLEIFEYFGEKEMQEGGHRRVAILLEMVEEHCKSAWTKSQVKRINNLITEEIKKNNI